MKAQLSKLLLITLLIIQVDVSSSSSYENDKCNELVKIIYRDITLSNLDKSYSQLINKILLGILHAHRKTKNDLSVNQEYTSIMEKLANIDSDFENMMIENLTVLQTSFINRKSPKSPEDVPLHDIVKEWDSFQQSNPDIFNDFDKSYQIGEWDLLTSKLIDQSTNLISNSKEITIKVSELREAINTTKNNILTAQNIDFNSLKNNAKEMHKDLIKSLQVEMETAQGNYDYLCSEDKLSLLFEEKYMCPIIDTNQTFKDTNQKLNLLSKQINNAVNFNDPPTKSSLVNIVEKTYSTNPSKNATFCKRSDNIVNTIVIHHTGTIKSKSASKINSEHLENGTKDDPWYMIGYNYLISEKTDGGTESNPVVIRGRPSNYKGAHAGDYTERLSNEQVRFYESQTIQCGNPQTNFTDEPASDSIDPKKGGISGNLISQGIAIIGEYSSKKYKWNGISYVPININSPDKIQAPSDKVIDLTARLSCQLQKENPNITRLVPHVYFKKTRCPGVILNYMNQIKERASSYGCTFNLILSKDKE